MADDNHTANMLNELTSSTWAIIIAGFIIAFVLGYAFSFFTQHHIGASVIKKSECGRTFHNYG